MATDEAGFNLLHEPWLTAVDTRGQPVELGLLALLERAPDLRGLADDSPLVAYAAHRLLSAVIAASGLLDDENAWVEAWRARRWPEGLLERVSTQGAGRFALFDPSHPFYQTGDVPLDPRPKGLKTVGYLWPDLSTGTNTLHFDHRGDADHALCGVCCAKGLLTLSAFATAGGAGIKAGLAGVPPAYVLPVGPRLLHTLLLNHLLPGFRPPPAAGPDPGPLWARDGAVPASCERNGAGWLESLTWAPRRVRLFPSAAGTCTRCGRQGPLVRDMVFQQGYSLAKTATWIDAWAAYKPKGGKPGEDWIPVRPREDRELWRDFPALFLLKDQAAQARPPYVLRQWAALRPDHELDGLVRYEAIAVRTDMKAKLFEWRHDAFDLAPGLLNDGQAQGSVERCLAWAEGGADALRGAVRRLHPVMDRERPKADAVAAAMKAALRLALHDYWARLESCFLALVADPRLVAGDVGRAEVELSWRQAIRTEARRGFAQAAEGMRSTARDLEREVRASGLLAGLLKKSLPEETDE